MSGFHARSQKASNTYYGTFRAASRKRSGLNADGTVDADHGESPLTRWMTLAFDYEDFASNPDFAGYMVALQIPPNTIALRSMVRIDTLFAGTGTDAVDVGDGDDVDGWAVDLDFTSTGLKVDPDAEFNWANATPSKYYADGGQVRVNISNEPTAGEGLLLVEVISYHEAASAEW